MTMDREEQLIEEARAGSAAAFSELVRLHQAAVRGCLSRYIQSWDVVDDLAQETFVKALGSLEGYRAEGSFRFWLLSIARNRALSTLREESRRQTLGGDALVSAVAGWLADEMDSEPADQPLRNREIDALKRCVQSLPDASAGLVEEFYFKRRSAAEISRRTGRKGSVVRMTLLRIRQALKRCIEVRLAETGANRE